VNKPAKEPLSAKNDNEISWTGLVHLSIVYVVWGSTYLAIRVGVRPEGGFPPFIFGALRVVLGGLALLLWAWGAGERIRLSRREFKILALSGILLWTGGNGLLLWAEQRIESGYAALLVGATPIWVAILESFLDRTLPGVLLLGSLLTGFAGAGLLSYPSWSRGSPAELLPVLVLMMSSLCWGGGSIIHRRCPLDVRPRVAAAYQHLLGCCGFLIVSFLRGESWSAPSPAAWGALIYLLLLGSVLAYTSYLRALKLLPTRIVFTYAYVNPVIAVFLGWLLLNEAITLWTLSGAALVLLGVSGVFIGKNRRSY
jgi:drug/metabolite transporter (DMT)-like permease